MKIEFNQNYTLDINVTKVTGMPDLYELKLTTLDPLMPKYNHSRDYYFEAHQLKQLANYLSEVSNAIE